MLDFSNLAVTNEDSYEELLISLKAAADKFTALCDVMRYSKKNPPKSPFPRGTFTAPLGKGGWGDKGVPHNSENCCKLIHEDLEERKKNFRKGCDESEALVTWANLCGASAIVSLTQNSNENSEES
ncbi:MAG: hypothetical protein F6K47_25175 [Symploca sp. SIO2E6]|nr:hypothetical protein [Symploca sp. SIO2E6]